ncbi:MAG: hypothetical protein IID40_07715 [Planctomycetes bacterium]|nr:hypothetical protein [Planctomycetota bacterium]
MKQAASRLYCGLLACLVAGPGCEREQPRFGKPVDGRAAVAIGDLLGDVDRYLDQPVVVRARIESVCQTAGCWCFFQDGPDRLYVSVTTFTLPPDVAGKSCRAEGKLVLRHDRPTFLATGIELLQE